MSSGPFLFDTAGILLNTIVPEKVFFFVFFFHPKYQKYVDFLFFHKIMM